MNKYLLGIDWGTSNRRAYLLDSSGHCIDRAEDGIGMLAAQGRFAAALSELLEAMHLDPGVPVLMSGMVGSVQGWQEAPYLDAAVPLEQLPERLAPVAQRAGAFIAPGYCYRADGEIDVMRGEETQLLGVVAMGRRDGWVVLPGTHSKWVLLRDGVVQRIATYMTGELFAMLAAGGTLAALMAAADSPASEQNEADDADAFVAGLRQARSRQPLSNALFRVRARVVAGAMPARLARSFVSGLLIGAEFCGALDADADAGAGGISLIASPALAGRYAAAAALFDLPCAILDPHQVYCSALQRFFPFMTGR